MERGTVVAFCWAAPVVVVVVDVGVAVELFLGLGGPELADIVRTDTLFICGPSSAMRMLTRAYSMSEANTKTVHEDMNMSMALMYDTGGNDFCD